MNDNSTKPLEREKLNASTASPFWTRSNLAHSAAVTGILANPAFSRTPRVSSSTPARGSSAEAASLPEAPVAPAASEAPADDWPPLWLPSPRPKPLVAAGDEEPAEKNASGNATQAHAHIYGPRPRGSSTIIAGVAQTEIRFPQKGTHKPQSGILKRILPTC